MGKSLLARPALHAMIFGFSVFVDTCDGMFHGVLLLLFGVNMLLV